MGPTAPFSRSFFVPTYLASFSIAAVLLAFTLDTFAQASPPQIATGPVASWMDTALSADQRADLLLQELTLEEKLGFLHGTSGAPLGVLGAGTSATESNGGAGMFGGVPRLNIPSIQMADASYGVTHGRRTGRYSTALPSTLAATASWDPSLAYSYGALIGKELRAHGYNMSLGGGVNLTREPRNGRTFEYEGEDPLLAGTMVGQLIRGTQAQHVIGDIKHFALNDQESGRNAVDITLDERAMRETDLLAFQLGIRIGNPGAVMCSYNRVGGDYACENRHLLTDVLKHDWKFQGFVLSDWGGTHSTAKALAAGLDNEEPNSHFFGESLAKALADGTIKQSEVDEHVHRILRTMFATGVIDFPTQRDVVDVEDGLATAQRVAERGMVLLKNRDAILPLDPAKIHSIVLIGAHADRAMISGGGSAQVDPPGGNVFPPPPPLPGAPRSMFSTEVWFPQSPLKALRERFPAATIQFEAGDDVAHAAAAARAADVAIVFGYQWESEAMDLDTLALGGRQNELIAEVSAANPHSIVVLETGGAVLMPWVEKPAAILDVWYAGSRGASALAHILAGDTNPSAKLPITFPLADADLPHPLLTRPPAASRGFAPGEGTPAQRASRVLAPFPVNYDEGLKVGYKWYDAEDKKVLFPFGFGLSYTRYAYSGLKLVRSGSDITASFTVANIGDRAGSEVAEVYATLPDQAGEPPKRLVAWQTIDLNPGARQVVTLTIDSFHLSVWETSRKDWTIVPGTYTLRVGGSSQDLPLSAEVKLQP